MTEVAPPAQGRFDVVGGAIFRRAVRVLDGDQAAAARLTEELFVRFMVHAGSERMDAGARWLWIYRVVTVAALRLLPEGALAKRLGLPAGERADETEAQQAILTLRLLDGLDAGEIAEVLGGSVTDMAVPPLPGPGHPSALALDREPAAHADHLASCARCRELVADGKRREQTFVRELAPAARERVIASIRAERARQGRGVRWKRIAWMTGATVLVSGLALLVARPHKPERAETPYADPKGASRAQKSGLLIRVRRGEEIRNLDPMAALRRGDRLHFRVRGVRPRYLELRVRGPEGEVRVFPEGVGTTAGAGTAALVNAGQSLDRDYVVASAGPARLWIVARFADRPFALDQPPSADIEEVPVRVDLE